MLDTNYIKEISELDKKESKDKLDEYAQTFGIKLKKTKTFDNMLADLEVAFKELSDIPMPENNEGLSIYDLIQADDEIQGTAIFDEADESTKALLLDSIGAPVVSVVDVVATTDIVNNISAHIGTTVFTVDPEGIKEHKATVLTEEDTPKLEEAIKSIIKSETFELPNNFSPNMLLMGKNPGYVTLPWWIYQWIEKTPDWKSKPTSFEHASAHQTLFSLIYYINRNGSILIRETKNSAFYTLE